MTFGLTLADRCSDYVNGSTAGPHDLTSGSHDAGSRQAPEAAPGEDETSAESTLPDAGPSGADERQSTPLETTASAGHDDAAGTPSAPREVEALIVSHRFITLRWKEPAKSNGHIVGYSVFYRQDGSERYAGMRFVCLSERKL